MAKKHFISPDFIKRVEAEGCYITETKASFFVGAVGFSHPNPNMRVIEISSLVTGGRIYNYVIQSDGRAKDYIVVGPDREKLMALIEASLGDPGE